ncbi:MAG TPA: outer membrane lipoprotein chaperone LolA, partial [Gammaproteobacteria bacterium]|nr:outer membrane lipoprotein chaperone LolA [Gammaproteobacteria bacterium]
SFNQVITNKKAKELQRSSGQMSLQRPGKFRWEIKKPNKQIVVTNGKKLWIYDPDLDQVTIRLLTKEVGDSPAMLLSNNLGIDKVYTVTTTTDANATLKWFLLKPKNPNNNFAAIKLGFQNNEIHEMILEDQMGQLTNIEFYNIKTNPMLASSLFDFRLPKNVDVIDETKPKH